MKIEVPPKVLFIKGQLNFTVSQQVHDKKVWVSKDFTSKLIGKMDDQHLQNTARYIERQYHEVYAFRQLQYEGTKDPNFESSLDIMATYGPESMPRYRDTYRYVVYEARLRSWGFQMKDWWWLTHMRLDLQA